MADGRDQAVWHNHAFEQWEENKTGHEVNDDYILRKWLLTNLKSGDKVLDFGCGGGLWRKVFKEFDYHGSDQNENMIRHAKMRFPDITDKFMVNDWSKLSYADGHFDLVFTSAVLQHNRHPDKEIAVKEIVRVLKPGGLYMGTENTFRPDNYHHSFRGVAEWREDLDDGYSFTWMGWEKFMAKFGLKLVEFASPSEYLYRKE